MPEGRAIFHAGHYNIIANQFSENLRRYLPAPTEEFAGAIERLNAKAASAALCTLAVTLAERLQKDNPGFDPLLFLDKCSPDARVYPLSELWGEDETT